MSTTQRRLLTTALALTALFVLGSWTRDRLGLQFDVESIRAFAEGLGPTGPLLFVLLVATRTFMLLPSQIILIAAGLCFGTLVGTLIGGVGLMLSGLILFLTARYAGRQSIEKRVGARARRILDLASHRSGAATFAIACAYPLMPLSPLQAAMGLTPMPSLNFIAAAFLGGSLRASIFAYFGNTLVDGNWTSSIAAAGLFLGAAAIPLLFPSGRTWLREIFIPPNETP